MIPQITEINFPEYATLSSATATLNDMGDKTITAQVKIDGSIAPDFSYDWEIEFQGERYIQPLRKPQGSKGNESICSVIDLTFYHKGIYDLKRYFFVSTVELDAGTLMADNYIVPLRLNIAEFVTYLNNVLKYYYGDTYKVFLNPDYKYDETDRKDIDINYTKIWDVVTKIYEWFGVRWAWETQQDVTEYYAIKIGYPSDEVSHIFEYGFEGGLLKFERQVQSPEIANVVFGRGSSENIPYRYFKNKSEDNPTFPADPDWIPELENVYFANLRGKTFRDYVKGWKAKHYGGEVMVNPTEEYTRGYNDASFNPIEYVKDDESIAKYGEIQKGLEHNEEIKPTIQGVTIEGIGRVDQIVEVEPILVDESTENSTLGTNVIAIDETIKEYVKQQVGAARNISVATPNVSVEGNARIVKDITVDYVQHIDCEEVEYYSNGATGESYSRVIRRWRERQLLTKANENISIINGYTHLAINDLVNIPSRTPFHILADAQLYGFVKRELLSSREDSRGGVYNIWLEPATSFDILAHIKTEVDYTPIHGLIFGNYENGVIRKSKSITIPKNGVGQVVFTTEPFTITEENAPATSMDMPFRVIASLDGAQYDARPNVVAINVDTGEQVASVNLPAGTYYLQNSIQINNLASKSQTFKVELLPTYIYYSYESTSWKPTFDIWVKNIWQTQKKFTDVSVGDFKLYETDDQYASRVWDAILGSHLGDDAKVVFSSGWLSGHSDWEFTIAHRPVYDTSKIIDGVPSEWRITLYKSDVEMEATSKWLPSIATHANAGDYFYFTGIELPHQYVLWAEERLDEYKREELDKVSDVDSTIVVQLDKVRLNQLQDGEARPLLNSLRVGNNIKVADSRFIASSREVLHLQSVTYTWDASTIMLPNIEVVLSDDVVTSSNPIKNMQYRIDETLKNVDAIRANSLAQISKAKKSIRDANASIKALSTGSLDVTNQVNALIGNDPWMSAREIAEDVLGEFSEASLDDYLKKNDAKETYATIESLNKKANKSTVDTLIGNDVNKSVRTIANEVLAGASTGGEIDLSLYLSKSEAETTYATKESLETANDSIDGIATRLGKAETNIGNNSNLLSAHSQQITTLQTRQESQKDTIHQQGATILALDLEVDGIKGGVSEANKAIEAIETELENKADKSAVDLLSKDLVSTKAVVEIISPQVNANADAIKGKASQEEVNALSESVTTLEGSVEEISNRVDNKADKGEVQTLVSQINNKVEQTTYNNKVAELEASIKTNKDNIDNGIVYLEGYSEDKANEAEDAAKAYADSLAGNYDASGSAAGALSSAKTYTDEEIAKVDTKADNALDKADKALADISELDASVKSSFDDIGTTFDTLDSVITGINTTATNALTKATEVEDEVDKLAKDVESNTKTIAEHTEIVTMLNNRCDSIEDTAEELESQISQIETNVTSLDEHIDEVEEKANNASAQASELAGVVTENTNKIDILVGTDNNTSARAIANNAIDQKTILLEDAATSQDDDGLVTAKDAIDYFASKSYVNRDVNRIDGEIAGIEASMSDLEEDIKGVDAKADNALATANNVKKKADNNEANIERLGQDVKDVENTLGTLNTTITQVSKKADNAVSQAESATTKAEEAKTTATEAKNTANSVSAQMSGVLTQVQNNTTQIDIIGKDYLRKDQAADFATDLTGVVEATAEEFVYRPSAGEKSIRDKSAVIRRIKGNSVVWEQKLLPLTSDNWKQYSTTYANIAFADNAATLTLTAAYTGQNVSNIGLQYKPSEQKYLSGHVYLIVGLCKLQSGGKLLIEMTGQSFETNNISASPNKWVSFGAIGSLTNDSSTFYIKPPYSYTNLREGSSYSVSNVMLFDLTAMFGAGNEPETVEDFRKVYNEAYYPYCLPELRGVKTGAIKTVGFNQFNKNSAVVGVLTSTGSIDNTSSFAKKYFTAKLKVLPNTTYYLLNVSNYYYYRSYVFFDAFGDVISSGGLQAPSSDYNASGTVTTPNNAAYMGVVVHNTFIDQCCINFSHSGVRNGEYEPYVAHWLELPEILTLFPNGMHAVGDVFDEINIDTYIQRCEYRDYVEGDESNAEVLTDGVHTVAKLAEPVVKVLPEPITLDYYCEDWGSEEAIPASSASAPFRADIVYQFNAEGRIRDNSRNIDKLEKQIQRAKEDIQTAGVQSDWLDDNPDSKAFIKNKPTMPTRVATAPEVIGTESIPSSMLPNVVYIVSSGLERFTLPTLEDGVANAHNVWKIIFVSPVSANMTFPDNIVWKDGIAPNWAEAGGYCELAFTKLPNSWMLGEWKIYK